jgi:hypothetical protein
VLGHGAQSPRHVPLGQPAQRAGQFDEHRLLQRYWRRYAHFRSADHAAVASVFTGLLGLHARRWRYSMLSMNAATEKAMARVRELVVQYRAQCLWFLRSDYFPASVDDAIQVLDYIQRYGDLDGFRQAGEIKLMCTTVTSAFNAWDCWSGPVAERTLV